MQKIWIIYAKFDLIYAKIDKINAKIGVISAKIRVIYTNLIKSTEKLMQFRIYTKIGVINTNWHNLQQLA